MSHSRARVFAVVRASGWLVLLSAAASAPSCALGESGLPAKKSAVYRRHAGADAAFRKLGEAKPGEWLHEFDEPGQTLEEYLAAFPSAARGRRIRIRPFGAWKRAADPVLAAVSEHLEVFWGARADREGPFDALPAWRRAGHPGQWDAGLILPALGSEHGPGDLAVLGATADDLGAGTLPFVFGLASAGRRSAVFSIARFGTKGLDPSEDPRLLRRALGVSSHETGHLFGLAHCVFYACAMNGSNTLEEADRRPLALCPECESKARAALGFDPAARVRRLEAFYARVGLPAEAAAARRILELRADGIHKPPPPGP